MAKRKEKKYMIKRKIIRVGSSYAVTIPTFLLEQKDLRQGDTVKLLFNGVQGILIEKETERKR
jgi:antitoxin component of MazEF toxin-antitoxin module